MVSRSGYTDDMEDVLQFGNWRAQVASATRGARGQRLLRDAVAALDALPEKVLVANSFQRPDGCVCTLGAVAKARGIDVSDLEDDGYPPWDVGALFDIAEPLAQEIMFMNDEAADGSETPEQRWLRMREWLVSQVKP